MESKKVFLSFILVATLLLVSSQLALATTPDDFHFVVKQGGIREFCKRNPDHEHCHNNRRRSAAVGKANGRAFAVVCTSVMIAAAMLGV